VTTPLQYWVWIALSGLAVPGLEGQPQLVAHAATSSAEGYLGIGYRDINAEQAKALKLPEETGVMLDYVDPRSPAAAAGLRKDDVVILYNGQRVEGQVQLGRLIKETPVGREVRIQIIRNGYQQSLVAKMGPKPSMQTLVIPPGTGFVPDIQVIRISWKNGLGVEWEAVDGQLASTYGVKDGGVLVRSVAAGSAAERGGLRAGDIIIRVGDTRVMTHADVTGRLQAVRDQTASVTVVRDKRETTLAIPLEGSRPGQ
jgi:serine protease Do